MRTYQGPDTLLRMSVPQIGQNYRGVDGHCGYLLRQAWHAFRTAMELALRPHGLTAPQFAVLSVLARNPGASNADLARACNTTPQAMNGVLATLERAHMIERRAHPTHGRILQVLLTDGARTTTGSTRCAPACGPAGHVGSTRASTDRNGDRFSREASAGGATRTNASATGRNGPPPATACPCATDAPASATRRASSSSNVVLPLPAHPVTSTMPPGPL
jgi:DNA-binding MarR family transcriptional regulator